MPEKSGLRRELGSLQAYATVVGVMVGSGIFVAIGEAAGIAGPSVPLAYLLLVPVILCSALGYAVFLSTPLGDRPGGAYIHISRTFGNHLAGFIFMWLKWVAYVGAIAVLSLSLGQYVNFLTPAADPTLVAAATLALFYGIHMVGVRIYGLVQVLMMSGVVVALVLIVVPGLFSIEGENLAPVFPNGFGGLVTVLPTLFFAYLGFEALAQVAGEVRDPHRTLPRVFMIGPLISGVAYFFVSLVAVGTLPWQDLAASDAPIADAAATYLPFGAAALVAVGAILAFATTVNANLIAPSRLLTVFAEDRVAPRVLSRVNRRFGTPDVALTLTAALCAVLIFTQDLRFSFDITLQALILVYAAHSATLVALPFVNRPLYETAAFKPPPWVLVVCGGFSVAALSAMSFQLFLDATVWRLILIWAVVGLAIYLASRFAGRRDGHDYEGQLTREYTSDRGERRGE